MNEDFRWRQERSFYDGPDGRSFFTKLVHMLIGFWLREWKWIVGTAIAVLGLFLAFKRL